MKGGIAGRREAAIPFQPQCPPEETHRTGHFEYQVSADEPSGCEQPHLNHN